ncbi:MAG: hypothetical protein QMD21_03365 [Candidatus Thermoplasmatota archaeon]|nr:hypothetical protein [Candidatus Thermoplasmatota archaeon]
MLITTVRTTTLQATFLKIPETANINPPLKKNNWITTTATPNETDREIIKGIKK